MGTDPDKADSDGDGMQDTGESNAGLDPNDPTDAPLDSDSDGLTNLEEYVRMSLPNSRDTDGDGLADGDEVSEYLTDPLDPDTDNDLIDDGDEVALDTDPINADEFIHVDAANGGDPLEDGSVEHPFDTIQEAIDIAWTGDHILVENGTYNERISTLGKSITVSGRPVAHQLRPKYTVIDGGEGGTVVTCNGYEDQTTKIQGFTITNGKATYGGGLYCFASSPTIKRCLFKWNYSRYRGGAIYCMVYSSPTITDCTIFDNFAKHMGGGIHCYFMSSPLIINTKIVKNETENELGGGGIRLDFYSDAQITNSYVCDNTNGGILSRRRSQPVIMNCTVANNTLFGVRRLVNALSPTITNCVIWGNEDDLDNCSATYSNIGDGDSGTGNITQDPEFTNPDTFSYRIADTSPCVDAGTASGAPPTDFDGDERSDPPDIGADEFLDTDDDWMQDGWEKFNNLVFTNSLDKNTDLDRDSMTNYFEYLFDLDATEPDTDGDGLKDGEEAYTYLTLPVLVDSDGDGMEDGDEAEYWGIHFRDDRDQDDLTNMMDPDSDNDGLGDLEEIETHGTDPDNPDTDNDGYDDKEELDTLTDPLDPYSSPGGGGPLDYYQATMSSLEGVGIDMNNTGDTAKTVTVTIFDEDGVVQHSSQRIIQPHALVNTWSTIGNVYTFAQPAVVRLTPPSGLTVVSRRWDGGPQDKISVQTTISEYSRGAGRDFRFALNWNEANVTLSNASPNEAKVTIYVMSQVGTLLEEIKTQIPANGVVDTMTLYGNIMDLDTYPQVLVVSSRMLVVDVTEWNTSHTGGSAMEVLPTDIAKGTEFFFPVRGADISFSNILNVDTESATVEFTVYDAQGLSVFNHSEPIGPWGLLNSYAVLGNIYDLAKPATVRITSDKEIVVDNLRYNTNGKLGWKDFIRPLPAGSGTVFEIPLSEYAYAMVNIGNPDDAASVNATISIYDGAGTLQHTANATVPARGMVNTLSLLGNIYDYAKPAVVRIVADGPVTVDAGRWRESGKNIGAGSSFWPVAD